MLKKRRLGRIGYDATIITLGGCGVSSISQEEAEKAVELALRYGVNVIDARAVLYKRLLGDVVIRESLVLL